MNSTPRSRCRCALLALACCGLALIAGCIEGSVVELVKYDAQTDTFSYMQIMTNLASDKNDELEHMVKLWDLRDNLIVTPSNSLKFELFAGRGITERRGKHEYVVHGLGGPSPSAPTVWTTAADLDAIKIIPGEFYLNSHRNLSYYQQVIVPGRVVDTILSENEKTSAGSLARIAADYLKQVEEKKLEPMPWDLLRKLLLEWLEKADPAAGITDGIDAKYGMPFEPKTLDLWLQAPKEGTIRLARKGDVLSATLPMTRRDAQEMIATYDLAREAAAERARSGKPPMEGFQEFFDVVALSMAPDGNGLTFSIKYVAAVLAVPPEPNPKPDESKRILYKTTAASLQGRGVPINREFSIDALVKSYLAR